MYSPVSLLALPILLLNQISVHASTALEELLGESSSPRSVLATPGDSGTPFQPAIK